MTSTGTWDWAPYAGDRWTCEKVGDKIAGKVIDIHLNAEGRSGPYPVVTVQIDEAGNRREIHPPTDLKRKFAEADVQVGDWVKIELVDLKHTGQPSPMKIFKLATKPPDDAVAEAVRKDDELRDRGVLPPTEPTADDTADLSEFSDDVF